MALFTIEPDLDHMKEEPNPAIGNVFHVPCDLTGFEAGQGVTMTVTLPIGLRPEGQTPLVADALRSLFRGLQQAELVLPPVGTTPTT